MGMISAVERMVRVGAGGGAIGGSGLGGGAWVLASTTGATILRVPQYAQNLASSAIVCPHSVQNIHSSVTQPLNLNLPVRPDPRPVYEPDFPGFIALPAA
jgi:hypothetical protein